MKRAGLSPFAFAGKLKKYANVPELQFHFVEKLEISVFVDIAFYIDVFNLLLCFCISNLTFPT